MNAKELSENYNKTKDLFHNYLDSIKQNMKFDFYNVVNTTLVKNPFDSNFPKQYFSQNKTKENTILLFVKSSLKFYIKMFYIFILYVTSFVLYKIYFKKKKVDLKDRKIIDIFFLVDKIISEKKFNENYFSNLYEVFKKHEQKYVFLPRLYGGRKNPFRLIEFFKILNQDNNNFLFEFELLSFKNLIELLFLIIKYPFKTLRLLQKDDPSMDKIFNKELIRDISTSNFDTFTRYILGKNISKLQEIEDIYSWSEFQVIERSFNYAIRSNNNKIKIHACQFYLSYETYFNTFVDDIDFEHKTSPHEVLVNGKYHILKRDEVFYKKGVALRYSDIFKYEKAQKAENTFLIGSYAKKDTQYMIECCSFIDTIIFKNHPAININTFSLGDNFEVVNLNLYDIFKTCKIVIGTASGTLVEAVACGLSAIVIASKDNLTANPLSNYGKGKIWDIAFNEDDVKLLYNRLLKYREENSLEVEEISQWYKDNFFIEPTEENIIKAFDLDKE